MTTFSGSYIDEAKAVFVASLLAGENAIALGAPGYGKTAVSRSLASQLTDDFYTFTRVDPSTPPDVVKGAYNPAEMLNGNMVRVTDGTPYDPTTGVAIIDEIGRANEIMFDALLDVCDRKDTDIAPPVWATSNFMPSNERVQALIDRFSLWVWLQPSNLDIGGIVSAQLNGTNNCGPQVDVSDLPSWNEVEKIRMSQPGPKAIKAITNLIEDLSREAAAQGYKPHPRRITQWSRILFFNSVWVTGTNDFDTIPDQVTKLLKYAWPCITANEQAQWAEVAASVVDAVGAAIESAMAQVFSKMKQVAAMDQATRTGEVGNLGVLMQSTMTTLEQLAGKDDPRISEAGTQMNTWLADVIQGKDIN